MNKLLTSEYFHILHNRAKNEHGLVYYRSMLHRTRKYDAWKPMLGPCLGNRWPSGTHIKGETARRRTSRRRNRKQKVKLLMSLATD